MPANEELIKILLDKEILSSEQYEQLKIEANKQKIDPVDLLIKKKLLKAEDAAAIKAKLYNLPYVNLTEKTIGEGILSTISSEVAENYRIVCFEKEGDKIHVGITDPDNFKAMEAVDFLAKGNNLKVEYFLISEDSFKHALKQYQSVSKELSSALKTREEDEEAHDDSVKAESSEDLEEVTKSAPVAKIVNVIIRHAVEGDASDIHIEPMEKESRVRYRIDGVLHTSLVLPISVHPAIVARIKVLSNLKLDETRIPQDGRIHQKINEKYIDFRVSVLPLNKNEKVVMRILDTTKGAPKLDALGYQGVQLRVIKKCSERTEGLILITGPTGSGKSTTLFSMLDVVNKEGVNISTLEDPVEYNMPGVNQSQIKPDIGYTFAAGLRSFLRQDPDIIMVGEIRDQETGELAIHAALTGHLVFSTLHTTNAPGAITRMVDMGIEPFLLGSTLAAVVAQRLARKICSHCKEEIKLPEEHMSEIKKDIEEIGYKYIRTIMKEFDENNLKFYKGKGCSRCGNTGYSGRISVAEVLDVNEQIKEIIISGKINLSIEQIRKTQEYITVKQDGIIKVLQGFTTYEDVLRVMRN